MSNSGTKSKYAQKRERGKQMYGPNCCGHDKPAQYNQKAVARLLTSRRNFRKPVFDPIHIER